jgi:hypothetical protein
MNPIGVRALSDAAGGLTAIGALFTTGASLSTVFAVRGRYKRSTGDERQRLRWLVFVASAAGIAFALTFGGGLILGLLGVPDENGGPFSWFFAIGLASTVLILALGIPAAYLIAILRYGLWDLDVVIRKAVQAAVIAVGLPRSPSSCSC